jgi:hypothetical protein
MSLLSEVSDRGSLEVGDSIKGAPDKPLTSCYSLR